MSDIQFPYTMYCPGCKVGIKIKKPEMIGRRINCPKCEKKITIVTPEEDGNIPYTVAEAHQKEPEPEPTEDELEEKEQLRLKELKAKRLKTAKEVASTTLLVLILGGIIFIWYYFIYLRDQEKAEDEKKPKLRTDWVAPAPGRERLFTWKETSHQADPLHAV